MSYKTIIECDACGADLASTDAMPRFRIELDSHALPHRSNIIYSILVQPEIDRRYVFCGLGCLDRWMNRGGEVDHTPALAEPSQSQPQSSVGGAATFSDPVE